MLARELMTEDVACATRDESISQVARLMREYDCGEIPIVDSQEGRMLQGVITDRDIVVRVLAEGMNVDDCTVADAMTHDLVVADPEMDIVEVARLMGENQIRRIPVVDQDHRLLGILSFADVTREAGENVAGATIQDISEESAERSQGRRKNQNRRGQSSAESHH